jgi:hypothetical protein
MKYMKIKEKQTGKVPYGKAEKLRGRDRVMQEQGGAGRE